MNGKDLKMERRMFLKGVGVMAAGLLAGCGSKPAAKPKTPKPGSTEKKVGEAADKGAAATKDAADKAAAATKEAADKAAAATKDAAAPAK
jgi:hypothetical protein